MLGRSRLSLEDTGLLPRKRWPNICPLLQWRPSMRACFTASYKRLALRQKEHAISSKGQAGRSNQQRMPESLDLKPEESPARGCLDKVLLVGVAVLVCVIGGAAFWFADEYHVNPAWVFVAWNSIFIALSFIRRFRSHLKKPSFVAYLIAWAVIHGLLAVTLMRWFSIPATLPFIAIELTLGVFAADYFFNIQPDDKEKK